MGCGGSTANPSVDTTDTMGNSQANNKSPSHRGSPDKRGQYNSNNNSNMNKSNLKHSNNNNNSYNNNKENRAAGRARPYPESKYAASNGSVSTADPHDLKGYKRRIRSRLVDATSGTDMDELEKAMLSFDKNNMEDCGEMQRAQDRFEYLKMKRDLRDSVRRSNVGVLEKTIADARASPYAPQLANQIEAAERKLAHLRELDSYSHDILAMDQSTISEIHSYHRPPTCVHDVMAASHMLLGYNESKLRDWTYLQGLVGRVGRDSLMHQVKDFDTNSVDQRTAGRVREILGYHDLPTVRAASNGAATFHVWATNIVGKINRDQGQEQPHSDATPDTEASSKRKGSKR